MLPGRADAAGEGGHKGRPYDPAAAYRPCGRPCPVTLSEAKGPGIHITRRDASLRSA